MTLAIGLCTRSDFTEDELQGVERLSATVSSSDRHSCEILPQCSASS